MRKLRLGFYFTDLFKVRALKQRLIFVVVIETIVILMILAVVSYEAIHSIEKNKLKTSMVIDLQQLTDKMEESYKNMSQVTQQMSPEGTVGSLLGDYFQENSNFEKYQLGQQISDNLVKITFSNSNLMGRTYFDPKTGESYFYDFLPYENFSPDHFNALGRNGTFAFHSLHQSSIKKLGEHQVLSVSRSITLEDERELIIYIESRLEADAVIKNLSHSQNMDYILLQLDSDNRIQFSSKDDFTVGQLFHLKDEEQIGVGYFGRAEQYLGVRLGTELGFDNVLLLPSADYNRELYAWIRNVAGILTVALLVFIASFILLSRLIYTPLAIFSKEMKKLGRGDLNEVSVQSGVLEFDALFKQFNNMKRQIQGLLLDTERMSQEKHRLEIEKIYYQINPHFLMNSLHSIHWLAKMHGQTEIENFITELNYILAYSLDKIDKQATLRTEVRMLQAYLKLQKMRYDFEVDVNIDEGVYLDTPTARMILQPIAENALHHGLGDEGCLRITVAPFLGRNAIEITFEDNGKGLNGEELDRIRAVLQQRPDEEQKIDGIGLRYVRYMLESFYGDNAVITIDSERDRGTRVTLVLPIDREKPMPDVMQK